jgi:formylmethanofuran dehydrogenase subunit E
MCLSKDITGICKSCGEVLTYETMVDLAVYVVCLECYLIIMKDFLEED